MTGQEGKTAPRLQIDIPANVFVCCEKWWCNPHLHCPPSSPPPLLTPPLWSLYPRCSESHPAIHFQHPKLNFPLASILTAADHRIGLMPPHPHIHCIPGSHFFVAIETSSGLLFVDPHHLSRSLRCPSWGSI